MIIGNKEILADQTQSFYLRIHTTTRRYESQDSHVSSLQISANKTQY